MRALPFSVYYYRVIDKEKLFQYLVNMLFETKLIDAKNYRKYNNFRMVLWAISFVCLMPILFTEGDLLFELIESGNSTYHLILAALVVLILFTAFFTYLTWDYKTFGTLNISNETIQIAVNESAIQTFKITELKYLEISRGSTYHRYSGDSDFEKVFSGDNFVTMHYRDEIITHEFEINSSQHNDKFEAMVNTLRKKYRQFKYLSI